MSNQQIGESDEANQDSPERNKEKTNQPLTEKPHRDDQLTAGHDTPEIATNDGSVIETLDTAFHGIPGWSEGENVSGSNRADYYEARSNGKSDAEEELDVIRERNKPKSS